MQCGRLDPHTTLGVNASARLSTPSTSMLLPPLRTAYVESAERTEFLPIQFEVGLGRQPKDNVGVNVFHRSAV